MLPMENQQTQRAEKRQTAVGDVFSSKTPQPKETIGSKSTINWQVLLRGITLINENYQTNYEPGIGVAIGSSYKCKLWTKIWN